MGSPAEEAYKVVLMDPPWKEIGGGKSKRGADRHYPVLSWQDTLQVVHSCPEWRKVSSTAHLYMWATNNFLPDALKLMEALGFRYVTNLVWVKEGRFGLGHYFRGQHELLLFGVRGKSPTQLRTDARNIGSLVSAPRGRHSEKPEQSYAAIEARSVGPRLEIFARTKRVGWVSWGNEV